MISSDVISYVKNDILKFVKKMGKLLDLPPFYLGFMVHQKITQDLQKITHSNRSRLPLQQPLSQSLLSLKLVFWGIEMEQKLKICSSNKLYFLSQFETRSNF